MKTKEKPDTFLIVMLLFAMGVALLPCFLVASLT